MRVKLGDHLTYRPTTSLRGHYLPQGVPAGSRVVVVAMTRDAEPPRWGLEFNYVDPVLHYLAHDPKRTISILDRPSLNTRSGWWVTEETLLDHFVPCRSVETGSFPTWP